MTAWNPPNHFCALRAVSDSSCQKRMVLSCQCETGDIIMLHISNISPKIVEHIFSAKQPPQKLFLKRLRKCKPYLCPHVLLALIHFNLLPNIYCQAQWYAFFSSSLGKHSKKCWLRQNCNLSSFLFAFKFSVINGFLCPIIYMYYF